MKMKITRRQTLSGGGALVAAVALRPFVAFAKPEEAQAEIMKFTGGKTPAEGKVDLEMPEIAENGNTVPLAISVDSPMTGEDHVKRVLLVVDGNPRPDLATFNFSPKLGVAEASTRVRLAKTQNVIAVAEMSDGSYHMAKRSVKVTIGGCGG